MREISSKAQATREKILRAANDLFYLHGYNATGLDRIIAAASVTKGNFYYHFSSKEELATAVLDWHRDLALAEIGLDRIIATQSPRAAVLAMAEAMARRMTGNGDACALRGCFFGNFALELSTGSEAVRLKVKAIFDGLRELLRDLLERAVAAGEVRPGLDPERAAGTILAVMEGAVLLDKATQRISELPNALAFVEEYLGSPATADPL